MLHYQHYTFNLVQENTYLIWDDSLQACIIDPGCASAEECALLENDIIRLNLTPVRCLCTHLHFDHILGCTFIQERWGLSPECSALEVATMPSLSKQLKAFSLPSDLAQEVPISPFKSGEEQLISFGNSTLQVLPVPGHSQGHVAFYSSSSLLVLSGDVLFREDIDRTDLWGGSQEALLESIHEKLYTLPPETIVLSGHGPSTTIGHEKQYNPYT